MRKCAVATLAVLTLALTALADNKETGKKPIGSWKRTAGDNTVTFHFGPDTVRTVVDANGNTLEVEADYGMSKDGVVFGRIFKVTKKGIDEGPSEGELFSFKIAIDKETLTISDFKTQNENESAKQLVQGEYHKEKAGAAKTKE
jgi:hypothetical protein